MSTTALEDKEQVRKCMKERLENMSPEEIAEKSEDIISALVQLPEFLNADSILFYSAKDKEVQTRPAIEAALRCGKKVFLPVTDAAAKKIDVCDFSGFDNLIEGHYGILEPGEKKLVAPESLDLVIVPGLAFDEYGNRIGYGNGYYDRLLKKTNAVRVGLAFDFQIRLRIPRKRHDAFMGVIVTEKRVMRHGR